MMTFEVKTREREDTVDITALLANALLENGLQDGAMLAYCPHTTAALYINEGADPDVVSDVSAALRRMVPREGPYRHAEGNSDAHIRAIMVGNQVLVPVSGGRMALGQWEHVFLAEFDGPRTRKLLVQFLRS
jgi:secondary thiamine-phosphate synthase enzyme